MFVHAVLFEIQPRELKKYRADSLMWARYAKKYKGFSGYFTVKRLGYPNQYASIYQWRSKRGHDKFMRELHEQLVAKSKARVKVLGYYNLAVIDRVRPKRKARFSSGLGRR